MKSLLQINLQSVAISKQLYSIKKDSLKLYPYHSSNHPYQYKFDSICYNAHDINEAVLYDLILQYPKNQSIFKEICLVFDQLYESDAIRDLAQQLEQLNMLKKYPITVSHFLINGNGLYDYHNRDCKLGSDSSRQNIRHQNNNQENFMSNFHRQVNLCEEVRAYQINNIQHSTKYINLRQFTQNNSQKMKKQRERYEGKQERELQNKKVSQFFVFKIGDRLQINCIVFNFNKNYELNCEQKKDLHSILTLHGSDTPEIKYRSIKAQIISKFLNKPQKLYYITYFPGPMSDFISFNENNKYCKSSPLSKISNTARVNEISQSTITAVENTNEFRTDGWLKNYKSEINSPKNRRVWNSTQKISQQALIHNYLLGIFHNYQILTTHNKQQIQNIIKDYIVKKQEALKVELGRVRESVKELKIAHRIEEYQVDEIKHKTIKALEKMGNSITELQKMGIKNIGKHIAWLQTITEEKKMLIKQQEESIEHINQRIVQNQQQHEYFVKKMGEYRDRLMSKYQQYYSNGTQLKQEALIGRISDGNQEPSIIVSQLEGKQINDKINDVNTQKLSEQQIQSLQIYRESLRTKMIHRLRCCSQKKMFSDKLGEIKQKISKMQFSRLEQKYFDLIIQ